MVETVTPYGKFDRIALQDSLLQLLKKCEHLFYAQRYHRFREESKRFYIEERSYDSYPLLNEGAKVLIFKPDEIGDALYALPALNRLRTRFPNIKLYLLCQEKTAGLYARTGLFDQIVGVPVQTRWLRFQSIDLESALDKFPTERFDLSVFLRTYPAYFRFFKKIPASQRVLPRDPRLKSPLSFEAFVTVLAHQTVQMNQILDRVSPDLGCGSEFPGFKWEEEDKSSLEKVFGTLTTTSPFMVLHPYARYETRRYPMEYWARLISEIKRRFKCQIVVIGAKEDPDFEAPGVYQAKGRLNLTQTGYLISRSAAFLGNESGPGHWASALGIPTVMIFGGHSHLTEWGPVGNHLLFKKSVPCENCYRRACPKFKVRCLTQLTPESVQEQLFQFLTMNGLPS